MHLCNLLGLPKRATLHLWKNHSNSPNTTPSLGSAVLWYPRLVWVYTRNRAVPLSDGERDHKHCWQLNPLSEEQDHSIWNHICWIQYLESWAWIMCCVGFLIWRGVWFFFLFLHNLSKDGLQIKIKRIIKITPFIVYTSPFNQASNLFQKCAVKFHRCKIF